MSLRALEETLGVEHAVGKVVFEMTKPKQLLELPSQVMDADASASHLSLDAQDIPWCSTGDRSRWSTGSKGHMLWRACSK